MPVLMVHVLIVPVLILCNSSDRLLMYSVSGSRTSIFVRKTLRVRPRDQQCICIAKLAEKDLRFSMKMMPAAGFRIPVTAWLNYYIASLSLFKRLNNL